MWAIWASLGLAAWASAVAGATRARATAAPRNILIMVVRSPDGAAPSVGRASLIGCRQPAEVPGNLAGVRASKPCEPAGTTMTVTVQTLDYASLPEAELVALAKGGRREAFAAIMRRGNQRLF